MCRRFLNVLCTLNLLRLFGGYLMHMHFNQAINEQKIHDTKNDDLHAVKKPFSYTFY